MTCIVSLKQDGRVFIGGDAAAVDSRTYSIRLTVPKVFYNGPYLIGYTSSFRMGQLLQYHLVPPTPTGDLHRFMCIEFVDAVKKLFIDQGYATIRNSVVDGGTFLVAIQGEIFEIGDDFQVSPKLDPYDVCGCGTDYALGSLYSTEDLSPKKRIKLALKAAEKFSTGVSGPFTILESK